MKFNPFEDTSFVSLHGTGVLGTQWSRKSSADIRFRNEGTYLLRIQIEESEIRLSHNSFNPDGGTWLAPPWNGDTPYYDLPTGEYQLTIRVTKNYGELDQITLVNRSFKQKARFSYTLSIVDVRK